MAAHTCLNIWIVNVYLIEGCLQQQPITRTFMRKADSDYQFDQQRFTLGNSILIFSYSGAIILQGPHHFAVKSSTDSFSALTILQMLNCCSQSVVDDVCSNTYLMQWPW